jgi:hypothetical protein
MHGAPHYTPHQIIEAGQRAESDGQLQYAIQFYRHVLDNFAGSPEAGYAHERLALLEPAPNPVAGFEPAMASSGSWPPPADELSMPRRQVQPRSARPVQSDSDIATDQQLSMPAIARPRGGAVQTNASVRAQAVAAHRDSYRMGRLVARVVTFLGWLSFVFGGVVALAAGAVQFGVVPVRAFGFVAVVLPFGGMVFVAGFVMIFFGQFARASFDTANATRELVAIARMKSGPQGPHQRHA